MLESLLTAVMILTLPVACCLVILRAREAGIATVSAISAVVAVWLLSTAVLPPLRAIVFALKQPPYWAWGLTATLCAAVMAMILLLPRWMAAGWVRIDGAESPLAQWFTCVTRMAASTLLLKSALSLEVIFALTVDRLSASGLIVYLSQPADVPNLSPETFLLIFNNSMHTFMESRDPPAMHAALLPGLALSGLAQMLAMAINLATALFGVCIEDEKDGQDKSVPKD